MLVELQYGMKICHRPSDRVGILVGCAYWDSEIFEHEPGESLDKLYLLLSDGKAVWVDENDCVVLL